MLLKFEQAMTKYPMSQVATKDLTLSSGFAVRTYKAEPSMPDSRKVLVLLNGGPGLPCEYLLAPHLRLLEHGWTVISYDQLGCGQSDRPKDDSLWTLERYVSELEEIVTLLGLDRYCLLGHSWGTWLGTEFSLSNQRAIRKLILADGACDIPHLVSELNRLRYALGNDTVQMMLRHEAQGTLDHEEYRAAITILNYRHVCRLPVWPEPLVRSIAAWNMDPYVAMQGPNEFTYTGNMRAWNRIPAMSRLQLPCLVISGEFDELPPSCSYLIHNALPDSRLHIFPGCSHMPFYEDPDAYFTRLLDFLNLDK